jgi:hypothetical protein
MKKAAEADELFHPKKQEKAPTNLPRLDRDAHLTLFRLPANRTPLRAIGNGRDRSDRGKAWSLRNTEVPPGRAGAAAR